MKKMLLSAAVLLFAISTLSASVNVLVKDTGTYVATSLYTFENLWIQSQYSSNFPTVGYGLSGTSCRGMAGKDGKILICRREAAGTLLEKYMNKSNILVYDGLTGDLLKTIPVPDSLFHQKDAVGDTLRVIGYPSNDIQVDNAGNVVLMSMTVNVGATAFVVAALKVDLNAGTVTQAKRVLNKTYPELSSGTNLIRFDTFNVYGDMFGKGFIMAPVSGVLVGLSNMVLRWEVTAGKADAVNFKPITISKYVPGTTAKFNDTAPRVKPISETLFYLDGQQSIATLYDMDGNLVDSIPMAARPVSVGNNGVDEFTIGTHNFVVYSHANTAPSPLVAPSSWAVSELGAGMSLVNMSRLYIFPKGGMGATSNAVRTAVPYIDVIGNVAYIYVYGQANGLAAYKLTLKPTGINDLNSSSVTISVIENQIRMSEEVKSVEIYSVTGQKLSSLVNVSTLNAPTSKGVYMVKIVDKSGAKKIQKVAVN